MIRFLAVSLLALVSALAAEAAEFTPFLEQHCFDCHDADEKKGGLDLTGLPLDLTASASFATWVKVHDAIASGDMPPKKRSRPPEPERQALLTALDARLLAADEARIAREGRATFRRLTRTEYQDALRDLLAVPQLEVKDLLPADGSRHGIDKLGEALDLSHVQLAKYLEAADRALDAAIATRATPPPVVKRRLYPTESFKFHMNLTLGSAVLLKDGQPDPLWPVPAEKRDLPDLGTIKPPEFGKLKQSVALLTPNLEGWRKSTTFSPMHAGPYRLRLSTWSFRWNAGRIEPAPAPETAMLHTGPRTLGYFEAPSLQPRVHELTPWLEMGDEVIFDPASFIWTGSQIHQRQGGGAAYVGPGIVMDWIEVEGPIYEQWPPTSHRALFGELPLQPLDPASGQTPPARVAPVQKVGYGWPKPWDLPLHERQPGPVITVATAAPEADAQRLLAAFLPRAFRREVGAAEVARYVGLVRERLEKKDCFELAMRHAYKAALTSPQFLFRREEAAPGPLAPEALATRLSFWLWNSTPDDELLALARSGKLREPATLRAQVERLLGDARSERFVTEFLDQWLKLRNIDATDPDAALYPEFHLLLKESMLAESRAFFRELLTRDLPVTSIVASDFAMLNQRLAEHYGIPGVHGPQIRRVALPSASRRGGFLTQAAVLKVTANGTVSSPVVRGVFVTERILGRPVPPVPPGVAAIDPDTRGATTIREQLQKHRTDPSCSACHLKIDAPGFALESYDVIGGWRDRYRSLEKGEPVPVRLPDGKGVRYKAGPAVDPSGETADGRAFRDLAEFQQHALADPDQIARALVAQMLTYATGAEVSYAMRRDIDRILATTRPQKHGVRAIVHAIAQSRVFQEK